MLRRGFASLPRRVSIYEVGARDGLQNEPTILSPAARSAFVSMLSHTGVSSVEAASFVSPKLVPQMAGGAEVMSSICDEATGVDFPVLVPNLRGFEDAVKSGARTMAVMTAASETFSSKNVNSTLEQQVTRASSIVSEASQRGLGSRGYISCALGCPFEGHIDPGAVASIAIALHESGCDQIVLSDTIGTGTPGSMADLLAEVLPHVPVDNLAVHCHDTYGQALANILCALQHGVATIDSSVAGLGGCPFAGPGASGNVATEDVVYMLHGLGVETGVDFDRVCHAGAFIVNALGRTNASKAGVATLHRHAKEGSSATSPAASSGAGSAATTPSSSAADACFDRRPAAASV